MKNEKLKNGLFKITKAFKNTKFLIIFYRFNNDYCFCNDSFIHWFAN